jgi:hypothetical protein
MLTEKEIKEIQEKGIDPNTVNEQIDHFKRGFPYINLVDPATTSNGIQKYTNKRVADLAAYFDEHNHDYDVLKFVPASGAASRMFKALLQFRDTYQGTKVDIEKYLDDQSFNSPYYFFTNLKKFAFYKDLVGRLEKDGYEVDKLIKNLDLHIVLDYFLGKENMNYGALPKGLLLFHSYPEGARLAVEEHLVEGAHYSTDKQGKTRIHLTVSSEHEKKFKAAIAGKGKKHEEKYGVTFDISFSQQKVSTDTIAVDLNNEPFRNLDGSLLFRPGGHGALIENLNDLDAEIIFIKNIDNVVPDRIKAETYIFKKAIGGLLMKLQEQTFEFLEMLEDGNLLDEELERIKEFAQKELCIYVPPAYEGYEKMEKIDFLFNKLNRPMRVCGMVKNEGEPGGGPFWVADDSGYHSLQIVESSQIDFDNDEQADIVSKSTHFNPVDLVCGVKNYKGENFDLRAYVDPETGFISTKSKDGKDLKAQELPGLWNGAMADWITIFVETPIITFNPVKTINDLLRPQHQPEDQS